MTKNKKIIEGMLPAQYVDDVLDSYNNVKKAEQKPLTLEERVARLERDVSSLNGQIYGRYLDIR